MTETPATPPPATVWDPFETTRPWAQQPVAAPQGGKGLPGPLRSALGLGTILGAVLILAGLFSTTLAWAGAGVLAVSIGALMLGDTLGKTRETVDHRLWRIAQINGWAHRRIAQPRRSRQGGRKIVTTDPVAARAAERMGDLLRPRPGQMIPFQMMAMYWGTARLDTGPARGAAVPFWMALAEYEMDVTLGAQALKTDALGNRGQRGRLYMLAAAYDLARDTGLRARLLAEPLPGEGWRDIKTESVAFNRAFSISIAQDRTGGGAMADAGTGGGAEMALLRVLTPAAQDILIDLHARYRVQVLIDGPTLFIAGQDRLNTEDDTRLAADLGQLVGAFARAALALKPYAE